MSLYKSLSKTSILSQTTKKLIASKITKEFSKKNCSEKRLFEILMLANHFQIPQLEEMLTCVKFKENIWKV